MNIIILLSFFIGVSCTATGKIEERKDLAIDGLWLKIIELLREIIKKGYEQYGIPILDPYQFNFARLELPNSFISIDTNFTNGTFTGLADFEILKLVFFPEKDALDVQIQFGSLNFTSEYYEMEGNIKDAIPLVGKGIFHIEIYDLILESKIAFVQSENGKSALIDRFEKQQFSARRIVSKTEYDNNIDEIANAMIEDLLTGYLNRFNKYLAFKFSGPLIDVLNLVLIKFELW